MNYDFWPTAYLWPLVPAHPCSWLFIITYSVSSSWPLAPRLILGSSQPTFCSAFVTCCWSSSYYGQSVCRWKSPRVNINLIHPRVVLQVHDGGHKYLRERKDPVTPTKCHICVCECSDRNLASSRDAAHVSMFYLPVAAFLSHEHGWWFYCSSSQHIGNTQRLAIWIVVQMMIKVWPCLCSCSKSDGNGSSKRSITWRPLFDVSWCGRQMYLNIKSKDFRLPLFFVTGLGDRTGLLCNPALPYKRKCM